MSVISSIRASKKIPRGLAQAAMPVTLDPTVPAALRTVWYLLIGLVGLSANLCVILAALAFADSGHHSAGLLLVGGFALIVLGAVLARWAP